MLTFFFYLQQSLCDLRILWAVKVQHLGSQAIVVGPHLMEVHHIGISIEHGPPTLFVHLRKLHRDHFPLPLVQALGQPQRKLHLCTLGWNKRQWWSNNTPALWSSNSATGVCVLVYTGFFKNSKTSHVLKHCSLHCNTYSKAWRYLLLYVLRNIAFQM